MVTTNPGRRAQRAMAMAATRTALAPAPTDAENLAKIVISTPSLRAAFFANPTKSIGAILPPPRFWEYKTAIAGADFLNPLNVSKRFRFRKERAVLAKAVFDQVSAKVGSKEMTASVNTDSVFAEFFAPIARVTQRSYSSIYCLSWAAFLAGLGLIVLGGIIGLTHPKGVDGTTLAGIFGGAGALSSLGSVYGMSVNGIREATYDLARTRVTLTGFAAQLGILRAVFEGELKKPADGIIGDVTPVNDAIAKALTGALTGIDLGSDKSSAGTDGKTDPTNKPGPDPGKAGQVTAGQGTAGQGTAGQGTAATVDKPGPAKPKPTKRVPVIDITTPKSTARTPAPAGTK